MMFCVEMADYFAIRGSGGILWSRNVALINTWGGWVRDKVTAFVLAGKGHGAFLSSCSYHCGMWGE